MSEITRREWLHRTSGFAVGAGLGSLVGESGVRLASAQGQPKRGGILRVATVDKPVNMSSMSLVPIRSNWKVPLHWRRQ